MSRFAIGRLVAGAVLLCLVSLPAAAWKPNTHVFLAERAIDEVRDGGSITLKKMDHFQAPTGNEPQLGTFAADPVIVDALRRFPRAFRAGVLGPDAYPDLMTGQSIIHAGDEAGGTDSWLVHVYESARATNDPEVLAFAVGFLAHAAGDEYGHTLVNGYTGAPWTIDPPANALEHMDLEGYLGEKTPAPADWQADIGPTVKTFIYRTMIDATDGTHARTLYDRKSARLTSLPFIFSLLRDALTAFVQEYRRDLAFYSNRASTTSFPVNAFWAAALAGHILLVGPLALYAEAWVADIDRGLRALPDVSMRVASTLIFTSSPNYIGAKNIFDDYWRHHVKSMLGIPDIVVSVSNFAEDVVDFVLPWNPVDALREAILEFIIREATHVDESVWLQHLNFPVPADPKKVELDQMLGLTGTNTQPNWAGFAAASNTVTMIKLLTLGETGLRQVLTALGYPTTVADELLRRAHGNAMLGFMKSLDGSRQWAENVEVSMFHADCATYQDLFVRQKGDGNEAVSSIGTSYRVIREDRSVKEECQRVASVTLSPNPNASTVPYYCEPRARGEVVLSGPVGPFGGRVMLEGDAVTAPPSIVWVPANQTRASFTTEVRPVRVAGRGYVTATRQNVEATGSLAVGPSRVTALRLREDYWEYGWQSRYVNNGEAVRSASRLTAEIDMDCDHAVRLEDVVVEMCPVPTKTALTVRCVVLGRAAAASSLSMNVKLVPKTTDGWYRIRAGYLSSYVEVEVFVVGSRIERVAVVPSHVQLSPSSTTRLEGTVELVYPAPATGEVVELAFFHGLSAPRSTVTVAAGQKVARFDLTGPVSPVLTCAGDIGVVSAVSRIERTSLPLVSLPARSATPLNPRAQFGYVMMDYASVRPVSECYDVGALNDADVLLATMMNALKLSYTRSDPRPVDRQVTQYLP